MLGLLALTQFLMTLDASVMNVSIGSLVDDLDTTVTAIQGVITAYTLVMAAGMITGGKLGDLLGRRRALRIGLVVYAIGSGTTALAPNVGVLLLGWSVIEGLGACLIMPTVTALIAGNFTGRARAGAYGTIAAAAAVAIALGPLIGGFVTAYFTWRWVFAAEVLIAAAILLSSRIIHDVPTDERPRLDFVGAVLSAAGLGLFVFGVLQSGTWGWVRPRVPDGPDATPSLLGLSAVTWLVAGGLILLLAFVAWQRRRVARRESPLVNPALFANRRLTTGLSVLLMQYLVMMGMFFAMPLFLTLCLGLDAFDTGVRMLPLSLALVATAPLVPRLLPSASPRLVVQVGLVLHARRRAAAGGAPGGRRGRGHHHRALPPHGRRHGRDGVPARQRRGVLGARRERQRGRRPPVHGPEPGLVAGDRAGRRDRHRQPRHAGRPGGPVGPRGERADAADGDDEPRLRRAVRLGRGRRGRARQRGDPPEEHDELAAVYASARLDALRNGMVALALFCVVALFFAVGLPERPMTGGP